MKLDKRLEFLSALAITLSLEQAEDGSDELNLASDIIDEFELSEDSVPNVDNISTLLMIQAAIAEIQDMIDEYNALERED